MYNNALGLGRQQAPEARGQGPIVFGMSWAKGIAQHKNLQISVDFVFLLFPHAGTDEIPLRYHRRKVKIDTGHF